MQKILLLLLFLTLTAPVPAQEKCDLTLTDAPGFFGLKLGMTPAEVKSVFGKALKLKIKKEGSFFQNFINKSPPAFLPNVRALYLRFFDYKLYQIEIFYLGENKTAGMGEKMLAGFTSKLSAENNLPVKFWADTNGKSVLNCREFSIIADYVLNPRIEITDLATRARFEESQHAKNEKKN